MRWIIAVLTVALLTLTGCGSATGVNSADPGARADGSGEVADLEFTAATLTGGSFDGAVLEGRPAVLWFWAPWCPTCRAQSGNVSALARQYDGEVAVVAVGGLDSRDAITDVADRIPDVTHVLDPDGEVWRHFGVTAQSTYTVISADGEIVSEGYLDDGQLNDLVARLAA